MGDIVRHPVSQELRLCESFMRSYVTDCPPILPHFFVNENVDDLWGTLANIRADRVNP